MADTDPLNLNAFLNPLSSVDYRKLLLLPVPPTSSNGSATNTSSWQGAQPDTAINPSPTVPGATAAGMPAYPQVAPSQVVAPIPMGGPAWNPKYPSPQEITGTLYNETASQRKIPGGSSLDELRVAMANAILNARDQNIPQKNYAASPNLNSDKINAIMSGIIHPDSANRASADAWLSSLDAGLVALSRNSAPTSGPGSGAFFNRRPDASTAPNTNYGRTLPFVGTLGPYYTPPSNKNQDPWWAFFGNSST